MSLKVRLTVLCSATLVIAIGAFAIVAITRTRTVLESRTNDELAVLSHGLVGPAQQQLARMAGGRPVLQFRKFQESSPETNISYAQLVLVDNSTVPLPLLAPRDSAIPTIPDRVQTFAGRGPFPLRSKDGTAFSAMVTRLPDSDAVIFVALADERTKTAISELTRTYRNTGIGLTLAFVVISAALVWLGLRPLSELTKAARRITAGASDPRLPEGRPGTEVGELTNALNSTLTQLDQLAATTKAFAADAAHELRTPVTSILGYSELYQNGSLESPDAVDRAFGRIHHEARRLAELTESLLAINRIDARAAGNGLQPVNVEEFRIGDLLAEVAADSMTIDQRYPVEVAEGIDLIICTDRDRVFQILANVLSNVRTHTPPGTYTAIEVTFLPEERFEVLIHDDGPGLAEGFAERAFERFSRGPSGLEHRPGSGLGLAIVAGLLRELDGAVTIESAQQAGTTVRISLPLKYHPPAS